MDKSWTEQDVRDEIMILGAIVFGVPGMSEIDYEDLFGWLLYYEKASPELKAEARKLGQKQIKLHAGAARRRKKREAAQKQTNRQRKPKPEK